RAITNVSLGIAAASAIVGAVLWIALPRTSTAKTAGWMVRQDDGVVRAGITF
ncbi:MAG: hypothetical protein JWM74_449, partial [Myxococcaceae bacterium]|nr:hypothetical protein [Myxococcaceae bacterium]